MIIRRFADLLIVVLGVVIGLALWNWSNTRTEAVKLHTLEDRLVTDLREEAWISAYILTYDREVLANAERALAGFENSESMSGERFLIAAYRASQYTWWNPRRAAYDELLAAGKLGQLKDDGLRSAAHYIYTSPLLADIADRGASSSWRDGFRMTVPVSVQRSLSEACGDQTKPMGDFDRLNGILDYPCEPELSPRATDDAVEALRMNRGLVPALRLRIATLETGLADLEEYNDIVQAVRARAPGEAGK